MQTPRSTRTYSLFPDTSLFRSEWHSLASRSDGWKRWRCTVDMERVPLCSLRSASARSPLPAMSLAFGAGGRSRRGSTSSSASAMLREQDERDGGPPSPRTEYLLGAIGTMLLLWVLISTGVQRRSEGRRVGKGWVSKW